MEQMSLAGRAEHFGWIAHFFGMDGAASSAQTQKELGWKPGQPGLIADLDSPCYFADVGLSASPGGGCAVERVKRGGRLVRRDCVTHPQKIFLR